jgi:membrane associated rhomboid family serine protease
MPVWARPTAFPEAPVGYGWVDPKNGHHPCGSLEDLKKIVSSDHGGAVVLVWTPGSPRMVLPEEVIDLNSAVAVSRQKWVGADLDDATSRLRRGLLFFGLIAAWVFYRQFSALSQFSSFGVFDRVHGALKRTLNDGTIELGVLLLAMFVVIPWYQARKRYKELGAFSTPEGLAESVPVMRFETWLERQKAPFTRVFLGLIAVVGLSQMLLPSNGLDAAGLVKNYYLAGDWWRLFTAPFMHGHPVHFAMNAAALMYLGKRLEVFARWPHLPLVFIFSAIIGGQASVYFLPNVPLDTPAFALPKSVGASGGLMGWLGFLLVFETLHARLVPRSARRRLLAAVVLTALIGLLGHRYIDNAAHAGGLIAGMLYAAIVFPKSSSVYRPRSTMTDFIGGGVAFAICLASAGLAIWKIATAS